MLSWIRVPCAVCGAAPPPAVRGPSARRADVAPASRRTAPRAPHRAHNLPVSATLVAAAVHREGPECGRAAPAPVPVLLVVALSGVNVCDPDDQAVRMSHALRRISYATCEPARALFAFVARVPRRDPPAHYCHAFETDTPEQAEELNALVGDAFRMAFASQLQPSAPLWSKELSGGSCARAPDNLPGLAHHYPHPRRLDRSQCEAAGGAEAAHAASPSSSEESSPTELSCYRRLGERPPLMRRLARGLTLLHPSDDDSTPLVTDTPTTPTNAPLGLTGGYMNEATEAEARARCAREPPPAPPPARADHDLRKCSSIAHSPASGGVGSGGASSSSGASSCGTAPAGGAAPARPEPELRHAPWFQQGIPREIALEVLGAQAVGAFLVRASTTQHGCLALSLRVPRDFAHNGIAHYLILRTPKGYKIKGFTKEFGSLSALVTHHSVMPELLPVPLRLPRAPRPPRADLEPLERLAPAHAQPAQHTAQHPHRAPLDV